MDEREAREDDEEEAAIPSSSRRMLPCLRVSLPHSRTAAASSASHALWPWQCYRHNRASVFVRMCKKCHVACVCRFRGWGLSVFSQDVSMYCKLYQSSKKTICEARGFPRTRSPYTWVGAGVGGSESTVNVTQLRVRVLMYLSRARATELSRLDGIRTPRPLPSVYE